MEDGGRMIGKLTKCLEICKLNAECGIHIVLVVPCESVAKDVNHRLVRMEVINVVVWKRMNRQTHNIKGAWDRHLHLTSGGIIDLVICGQEDEFCEGFSGSCQKIFHPGILPS